jgi:hypothetical protein
MAGGPMGAPPMPMLPPGKKKRRHGGKPKVRHRKKLRKM